MDKNAELDLLRERVLTLEDTIEELDFQIEKTMYAVAAGTDDIGHAMGVLNERRNTQSGFMFELGKLTAQIEDLENRMREQNERGLEAQAVRAWESEVPMAEDHLDWLRPVLETPDPEQEHVEDERHPHHAGEEREPEDYLDWLER